MYHSVISFPKALAGLLALLCLSTISLFSQVAIPGSAAVSPAVGYPGGSLKGEYWKRVPVSILTDGSGNRADGIDNQINTFGAPSGTFKATKFVYLGNDLTQVQSWLSDDGPSYSGISSNLDDGAFRFTGFINIAAPGTLSIGTTSDDGARVKIGGVDVVNGDGSHGDETHDADASFANAGLYPIEITYFNGDWTSDGNNHTGNPDPGAHGGANFHLRMSLADVTSAQTSMLYPVAPRPQAAIGLNFGADEPNGAGSAVAAGVVAGAVPQANWNNLTGANGNAASLVADAAGAAVPTAVSATWSCPNTWSSTGRGEENNGFAAGSGDQALMTGYLDTDNAGGVATVTVSGLPADFTSGGYDVLVYCVGGVAGRGGAYTINGETKYGTASASASAQSEDPGANVTDTGTYVRFRGLFTSTFTLVASANAAIGGDLVNFRAPINGIQIVRNPDPQAGLARGYLVKHRYDNIGNSVDVNALLTNPKYLADQFDVSCLRTDFSENDGDECDNCGYTVRGFFIPKTSGPHTFYMSSDDGGALFLSTDDSPANKVMIASEPLWSGRKTYIGPGDGGGRGDPPSNISAPINLAAGTLYYIEGVTKEAGGGDNLDVAVQGPGDPPVQNGDLGISGDRIAAMVDLTGSSLTITQNPAGIRVPEGDTATFSVGVAASSPLCGGVTTYQWQRDGVDIPGARSGTYSFGPVRPEDHLTKYSVVVRIPGITRTSAAATLEVLGRECLKVVGVVGSGDLGHATVQFSTFLDPANQANTDPNNYEITGPGGSVLAVSAATLLADGKSVTLATDPQAENTLYTVTVLPDTITSIVGTTVCAPPTNSGSFTSWVTDPNGGILFEAFFNIGGTAVSGLTSNPNFPNSPDVRMIIGGFESRLAFGDDSHENYGGRMRGLFIPPASGAWVFYLASDDASQLFLNPNGPNAAGAIKIQEETGCCGAYTGHKSLPYNLVGGQPYYIEALYKEGGGGDYCRVEARFAADAPPPGGNPNPPDSPSIAGALLGSPAAPPGIGGPLTITQQPADQNLLSGSLANFSVVASNPNGLPITYQWTRDGADIPGANGPSYSFGPVSLSDDGAMFTVRVGMIGASATSRAARLGVTVDTVRPTAVSASAALNLSNVVVRFSEFMHAQELGDPANYSVPGFNVIGAAASADARSATLTLDGSMVIGGTYSVVVNSLIDLAGNTIDPDPTTLTFKAPVLSCGFALQELYMNIGGVAVSDLTGNPKYPNSPDSQTYVGLLEGPLNAADNYGTSISGWILPPVSGNYNFFISSDDNSAFFLSTDDNPANLVQICNEPAWASSRHWTGEADGGGRGTPPLNQSSALFPSGIPLVAGQPYYFRMLAKEGGGGDNCAVAWQLPGGPVPDNGSSPISGAYMAALADPVGAQLDITQQPGDRVYIVDPLGVGGSNVTFSVAISASRPGDPNPKVFYQWYRDSGAGFVVISGANAATYTFTPKLVDNGARFRCAIYIPGATVTSATAGLTVAQPNTPPRFNCGTNQLAALEDSGPQSAPGWATGIVPHSITRTPVAYSTTFDTLDAGTALFGSPLARLDGGFLKLTDAHVNSAFGAWVLTTPGTVNYESLSASWKSRVGGGDSGADGYSLNIGDALPNPPTYGNPGEEGSLNGLSVTVDTFDNGGGETGIEIRWQGSRLAFQALPKDDDGSGNFLRKDTFVNASLDVFSTGLASFTYDGNNITAQLPSYAGVRANQVMFGGRTGGANDNQWIDDFSITAFPFDASSQESGQTVHFIVSNDNPSLFSAQPAVDPNGTLTYTPAPDANGSANVRVVAQDNGGTAFGGNDTSTPCSLVITITPVNDCPVAANSSVTVNAGSSVNFQLNASDVDGDALTYIITQPPVHGVLTVNAASGAASYAPVSGYIGPDSLQFKVNDGHCDSVVATVTINVRSANTAPTARITATPLVDFTPTVANKVLISCNGSNACVQLDGSLSSDAESPLSDLTFVWSIEPSPVPFATGVVVSNCLDLGTQTILLTVTDPGGLSGTATLTVDVLSAGDAVDELITKINESTVARKNKRPFIATLKAAAAAADRGQTHTAANQLHALQNKIRAQIAPSNPQDAALWIQWAQNIIDALNRCN